MGQLRPPPMSQQLTISAFYHCYTILHQCNGAVTQWGRFPWHVGDTGSAINCVGDLAICCCVAAAIKCLEHETKPSPLLAGESRVRRDSSPQPCRVKSGKGFDATKCVAIKRDQRRKFAIHIRSIQNNDLAREFIVLIEAVRTKVVVFKYGKRLLERILGCKICGCFCQHQNRSIAIGRP